MVLTLPHRKRPFHEFMPLWKEHAASPRESRLASFNFHRQREEEEEEEAKGTEFYDQPRRGPRALCRFDPSSMPAFSLLSSTSRRLASR